ncbi:ABC transporter permease subunit [Crassaminicella profunda]|uniref:ABC transporter permease subunit n=1 Tax=Crassaminicella profunda TaxID=1286698 RepID=UPI001CA604DF|nr:ABC transporter permease subunit [Crassaminicella profunda]QZY55892.1 ABC transporter permease subunit [Crassaminicella profunda]
MTEKVVVNEKEEKQKIRTPISEFWRKFKKQKVAVFAGGIICILVILAIFGEQIAPYALDATDYDHPMEGPSLSHFAGTDAYGRDILSRIIIGSRISLVVGLSSVTVGMIIGSLLGLISGYYGGILDNLIMRFCDVLFAFPGILLAIAIVAILGPGLENVVVAVATFSIPVFARIVRGSTLSIKETVYVEAAKSIGTKNYWIMLKHILPGTASSIIVFFTMRIGTSILTAASLSFIGLGAQPPTPEWGAMLSGGRDYLNVAPHITIYPGLAIFITVLAFNLLGDGLRDALDPKLDN